MQLMLINPSNLFNELYCEQRQCSSEAVQQQCSSVAVQQCSSVAVQQCSSVAVQQCSSVAVQQCSNVAVQQCSSVIVVQQFSFKISTYGYQRDQVTMYLSLRYFLLPVPPCVHVNRIRTMRIIFSCTVARLKAVLYPWYPRETHRVQQ